MYGLVHRAVQCFAQDTYGAQAWERVAKSAGLRNPEFESMLSYPDHQLDDVLVALSSELGKPQHQICEDVGAYLVTHSRMNSVRRLLRFGGASYLEFVLSLDELHDRVRLALPELQLPRLEVQSYTADKFDVSVDQGWPQFGSVLLGLMRAMADDYGALAMMELSKANRDDAIAEMIHVELFDTEFSDGRDFDLVNAEAVP